MNDAAPRITAGYDPDAPRDHVFPIAVRPFASDGPAADPAALAGPLAAALEALCGVAVRVSAMAGDATPAETWQAADGSRCGIGGGLVLAAALLNRQCGGEFEAGAVARSAHVERSRAALSEALREAMLPDADGWQRLDAAQHLPASAFAVEAGGINDRIDLALLPAAAEAPAPASHARWRRDLRGVLDGLAVPVRLVLHEGAVAVRAARALAVGDVLPIATAHEVGLRVGTLALARGHIVDSDTATPRVRIVARGRRTEGA